MNRNPGTPPVMPSKDKLSYAIGMYMGNSFKRDHLDIDLDTFLAGVKETLAGTTGRMNETEMRSTLQQLNMAMRYRMQHEREEAMAKQGATNKIAGEAFLAKHATEEGVQKLPSGIEYKVLKEGSGANPKPTDTVVVAYKGTLINGTEFDHNDSFKTPVTGRIIRGWSEILPMMKVGSKWEVAIPPDLAYGKNPAGPKIPPESVLIFDIELKAINNSGTPTAAMQPPMPSFASRNSSTAQPVVSGQIIKVPSADELKHGAKIEVITNTPSQ